MNRVVTTPRPVTVPDIVTPKRDPFAPDIFKPDPFGARDVFHPTGFDSGSGGKPPRPPFGSVFDPPHRDPGGRGPRGRDPQRRFVHRQVVLIPPGRPRRRSRFALNYDTCLRIWADYNECSLELDLLAKGSSGLDFTRLGECAAEADHRNDYCPFDPDFDWSVYWGEDRVSPSECPDFHGVDAEVLSPDKPFWSVEDEMITQWWSEGDDVLDPEDQQILVFERTHDDTPALSGKYVVTDVIVHRWDDERPAGAPDYMTGWHEVFLAPCDDEWNLID